MIDIQDLMMKILYKNNSNKKDNIFTKFIQN